MQIGQSGLYELTWKKQPDCPSEQHAEHWHVPQQEQPEVHRRGTRHEVDEDVGVGVRLHPDRQLVGKVAHRLLWAITEQQVWVVPKFQTIPEVPDEVTALVHRGAEPSELAIVEHSIEEHDPLDHASLRGGLPEAVVGLANGRPERLVVEVKHPPDRKSV